jgi:hypothetical protein
LRAVTRPSNDGSFALTFNTKDAWLVSALIPITLTVLFAIAGPPKVSKLLANENESIIGMLRIINDFDLFILT